MSEFAGFGGGDGARFKQVARVGRFLSKVANNTSYPIALRQQATDTLKTLRLDVVDIDALIARVNDNRATIAQRQHALDLLIATVRRFYRND